MQKNVHSRIGFTNRANSEELTVHKLKISATVALVMVVMVVLYGIFQLGIGKVVADTLDDPISVLELLAGITIALWAIVHFLLLPFFDLQGR